MNERALTRLRLYARDAAALAAFLPLALSGAVPTWALAAAGLSFVLSLFNLRPFAARTGWSAFVLMLAALLLFGAVFRGGLDLIVAACTFASLVSAQRILSTPNPAADHQVHLVSLLMIAGGAALTGDLTFGLCLGLFSVASMLSLGLGVLERPDSPPLEVPLKPLLSRLLWGGSLAMVGALVFFIVFPRLSWNVAARRSAPGFGGQTGMSDRVRLTGGGGIKTSPRVVARVSLSPDPQLDRLEKYWVGRKFDRFDLREWSGSALAQPPTLQVTLGHTTRKVIHQRIELLPSYEAKTLIALDHPVMFGGATALGVSGPTRASMVEAPDEEVRVVTAGNAFTYQAYSIEPSTADKTTEVPDRYLALPAIDPRIERLATEVSQSASSPLSRAQALTRFLRDNYSYTLELPGELADPLADFLFSRKQGHCEHFATALAVMLRTQGIASRVVAGFYGGERIGDQYVIRAGDAHAWAEAFIPGEGWVQLDATPSDGRGARAAKIVEWVVTAYEQLEAFWRARVVDYTLQDQIDFARALVRPPQTSTGEEARLKWPSRRTWAGLGMAALLVLAMARLRRFAFKAPRHPATTLLDQIEARLRREGLRAGDHESLEELSARLTSIAHPWAAKVARATRGYVETRFGGQALTPSRRRQILEELTR